MKNFFSKIFSYFADEISQQVIKFLASENSQRMLPIDITLRVLSLQPGDKIVLKTKSNITDEAFANIKESMDRFCPGYPVVILEEDLDFLILRTIDGRNLICPSCQKIITDQFITNSEPGTRIRCPNCESEFEMPVYLNV